MLPHTPTSSLLRTAWKLRMAAAAASGLTARLAVSPPQPYAAAAAASGLTARSTALSSSAAIRRPSGPSSRGISGTFCSSLLDHRRAMSTQGWAPAGSASERLSTVCTEELHHEEQRDAMEGAAAIPPMVPSGWAMEYRPSTNYFLLRRNKKTESQYKAHAGPDASISSSSPRVFRSRQEEAIAAMRGAAPPSPTGRSSNTAIPTTDLDVIVYCPMRTQDPSLHDATVDLCEWAPFDVLVRKPADATADLLFLSLASVNSELRVRAVQVLRPQDAKVVLPHAVGGGLSALDVVRKFGVEGEYYRDVQLFRGPLVADLSKPMREELLTYIQGSLGITDKVREYVCQMLFVVEQEAYTAWLAQLAHFGRGGRPTEGGGEGGDHHDRL